MSTKKTNKSQKENLKLEEPKVDENIKDEIILDNEEPKEEPDKDNTPNDQASKDDVDSKKGKNLKDKEAQKIFASYKACNKLHKTSDGYFFFEKSDAVNHARSLKNQEIAEIKR